MRDKLNNNPLAQVAILGVLLVAVGFFVFSSMGGGSEEEPTTTTSSASITTPEGSVAVTIATPGEGSVAVSAPPPGALAAAAPPPPRPVTAAFAAGNTVVLLFVREGGIDDRMVAHAVDRLHSLAGVSTFVVPADRIARYAAITQGVELNRVPALVVLRPRRLDGGTPTASVYFGFQSPERVQQAVIDAGYEGPTFAYHP
jgi:hypothetical protein